MNIISFIRMKTFMVNKETREKCSHDSWMYFILLDLPFTKGYAGRVITFHAGNLPFRSNFMLGLQTTLVENNCGEFTGISCNPRFPVPSLRLYSPTFTSFRETRSRITNSYIYFLFPITYFTDEKVFFTDNSATVSVFFSTMFLNVVKL